MTWWGWVLWIAGFAAMNAVVQPWVQRVLVRRHLRARWAVVSAQAASSELQPDPPQWRLCRATREDDRTLLRSSTEHRAVAGVVLLSLTGPAHELPSRGRLRVVVGARRAMPVQTSAGLLDIAARDDVLAWLQHQLPPG